MIYLQVWKAIVTNDPEDEWIWELKDELLCTSKKDAEWKARCYLHLYQGVFRVEIVEK